MFMHAGRGIFKDKPSNWDDDIPFCDPNNAENRSISPKKPSRETMRMMMKYLVKKFKVLILCYDKNNISSENNDMKNDLSLPIVLVTHQCPCESGSF